MEAAAPNEHEVKIGPLVTNREIQRRVAYANKGLLKLSDTLDNRVVAAGSLQKDLNFYSALVPDQNKQEEGSYIEDRGSIQVSSVMAGDNKFSSIFQIPDLDERLQLVEEALKPHGVQMTHSVDTTFSATPAGVEINFSLVQNEAGHTESVQGTMKVARHTRSKKLPSGELGTQDSYYSDMFLNIPYGPELDVMQSLSQIVQVFDEMQKAGLLTINPNPILSLKFAGELREQAIEKPPLTKAEYVAAVDKIKITKEPSSPNLFVDQFQKDLAELKFLPYNEAIRLTRSVFPQQSDDLVARETVCEVGKKVDGEWVLLLPTNSNDVKDLTPDISYLDHNMATEFWESDRPELVRQLLPFETLAKDEEAYFTAPGGQLGLRAAFIEFASSKRVILVDANVPEISTMVDTFKANYNIAEIDRTSTHFERLTYERQVNEAIERDTQVLSANSLSQADIQFYRYWAGRFWLKQDRDINATHESVSRRFLEFQDTLRKIRK